MSKLYIVLTLVCGLFCSVSLTAQDIHFSQFYMSPTNLNPAMTGVMNCNTRVVGNYRSQWSPILKSSAYNTYSVAYDQKLPVGRYDYFGFGANVWRDVAGALDFGTTTGKLLGAYTKRVAGDRKKSHYISFGVEAGISQRGWDILQAQWGEYWDGSNVDINRPSGEGNVPYQDNFLFADVGLGVLWFSVLDDNNNFYIGAAIEHLNQANISLIEGELVPFFTKSVLHAGGEFRINPRMSIVPGVVLFDQGPSFELNGGTSVRFQMGSSSLDDQSFQLGAWIRLANHYEDPIIADAIIFSTRFDMEQFGFGFSYDVNVSSLRQASNANGSFEFSMVYYMCGPQNRGVYCPRF